MNEPPKSARVVALSGLATLALIMGIGRFAFTPILPMMQSDWGVTVAEGGWLASANYIGYLVGGLSAMRSPIRSPLAIRIGLIAIAICTFGMAFEHRFAAWIVLRALPGFASAWVMVYLSAWVLESLTQANRGDLGGVVYAGVGAGIVLAGVTCLLLQGSGMHSSVAWVALGTASLAILAFVWRALGEGKVAARAGAAVQAESCASPDFGRLVLCYGAFGLGYIIPATFLPVMAKQILPDPSWFGWAWPLFGVAAALSTLAAAKLNHRISNRTIWLGSNLVMAAGIVVPIALPHLVGIAVAALCVGGTFMVITMVGLQEARKVGGRRVRLLMGAMTSSFGVGQILGPVLVSSLVDLPNGFAYALAGSAVPLLAASYALSIGHGSTRGIEIQIAK